MTNPDLIKQTSKALDKAKIALMSTPDSAFFTTVCFSLKHVWSEDLSTAGTDGQTIWFNPQFFMALSQSEQVFLLLHETLHVAFMHPLRLRGRHRKKWNNACDYVINLMLVERGFKMPEAGLLNRDFKGLSAEQVYDLLPDPPPSEGQEGCDLIEPPGDMAKSEEAITEILVRAQVQSRIAGDRPGSIPGEIEIFLENLLKPRLPWQALLRRFLNSFAKHDYSWRRPNRRHFPDHYLPSLYSEAIGEIAIAVDTSASVTDNEFRHFISEVQGILKSLKPTAIQLIQFDTKIKSVDRITSVEDLLKVTFTGRGGTRIHQVMEWAEQHKPQCLLLFSDGKFYVPSEGPKTPILWIIHDYPQFTADFGKVVHYSL